MFKNIIVSLVVLSSQFAFASGDHVSHGKPMFIAVVGDSVTKGTMANEVLGNPSKRFYHNMITGSIHGAIYEKLKWMSLNPKRDAFFEADRLYNVMSRPDLSWAFGKKDYSIFEKIEEHTGKRPKLYNAAILGSGYFGYKYILEDMEKWLKRRPFHKSPDMVILSLGGMDIVNNKDDAEFKQNVRHFLTGLTQLAPNAHLVVTGVPNPIYVLSAEDRPNVPVEVS